MKCPECGGPMASRTGKYGVFWGCKKFPECKGTRDSMGRSKADREEYKRTINKDNEDIDELANLNRKIAKECSLFQRNTEEGPRYSFNKKKS